MGFAGKDAAHARHHEAVATLLSLVPPHTICGFSAQNALRAELFRGSLEQPTLFYALCVVLILQGVTGAVAIGCAWAYVILRVLHSLVQTLGNRILLRFAVFTVSTLALFGMCAVAVWHGFIR